MRILRWNGVLLFYFSLLLQCHNPQYNSFKIAFHLELINGIDLHYRHRMKIFYKERTCAHLEHKETTKTTHFLLLKTHLH